MKKYTALLKKEYRNMTCNQTASNALLNRTKYLTKADFLDTLQIVGVSQP